MVERHALAEFFEPLLALAAANDFPDAGHEQIHRGHGLAVGRATVGLAHVERLDRTRIIVDRDRALEVFLGEITFVLGLKIGAPADRVLPRLAALGENFNRVGVTAADKGFLQNEVEAREQILIHKLTEKFEVGRAVRARVANEVFHEFLGERHVAIEIAERDLGLDHPKFRGVAGRMGVLRTERGAERVNVGERRRENLRLQLATHSEKGLLRKKVFRDVNRAIFRHRRMREVERRHAKHIARALGVARRDDRRVHAQKIPFLEKLVHRVGEAAAHTKDRAEEIRTRPQVRDLAEELQRVAFFLERVGRISEAEHHHRLRDHLPFLTLALRGHELAADFHRGASVGVKDFGRVVRQLGVGDDLDALEAGTVIELDERKGFGVAAGADPALEEQGVVGSGGVEGVFDESAWHGGFLLGLTKRSARAGGKSGKRMAPKEGRFPQRRTGAGEKRCSASLHPSLAAWRGLNFTNTRRSCMTFHSPARRNLISAASARNSMRP